MKYFVNLMLNIYKDTDQNSFSFCLHLIYGSWIKHFLPNNILVIRGILPGQCLCPKRDSKAPTVPGSHVGCKIALVLLCYFELR